MIFFVSNIAMPVLLSSRYGTCTTYILVYIYEPSLYRRA